MSRRFGRSQPGTGGASVLDSRGSLVPLDRIVVARNIDQSFAPDGHQSHTPDASLCSKGVLPSTSRTMALINRDGMLLPKKTSKQSTD